MRQGALHLWKRSKEAEDELQAAEEILQLGHRPTRAAVLSILEYSLHDKQVSLRQKGHHMCEGSQECDQLFHAAIPQ